jgi:hypothetical protein
MLMTEDIVVGVGAREAFRPSFRVDAPHRNVFDMAARTAPTLEERNF